MVPLLPISCPLIYPPLCGRCSLSKMYIYPTVLLSCLKPFRSSLTVFRTKLKPFVLMICPPPLLPFLLRPLSSAYDPVILSYFWLPDDTLFSSDFLPLYMFCLVCSVPCTPYLPTFRWVLLSLHLCIDPSVL